MAIIHCESRRTRIIITNVNQESSGCHCQKCSLDQCSLLQLSLNPILLMKRLSPKTVFVFCQLKNIVNLYAGSEKTPSRIFTFNTGLAYCLCTINYNVIINFPISITSMTGQTPKTDIIMIETSCEDKSVINFYYCS